MTKFNFRFRPVSGPAKEVAEVLLGNKKVKEALLKSLQNGLRFGGDRLEGVFKYALQEVRRVLTSEILSSGEEENADEIE